MLSIHENIETKLNTFIHNNKIPNIIFHGENGCGKKTILSNFLNKIYEGVENKKDYIMYVNCAFGKGIKFIRDDLKFFAKSNINSSSNCIKSIILLDCELLTTDAQSALRRCIELFSKNTRFFIVVNDKEKLLKPIISRFCSIFVPIPLIDNKITNLHDNISMFINKKDTTQKNNYIKRIFTQLNSTKKYNIFEISTKLYEKGISINDIINYINENLSDANDKYSLLLSFDKYRYSIRNDELLICELLNLYRIRKDLTLENIYKM